MKWGRSVWFKKKKVKRRSSGVYREGRYCYELNLNIVKLNEFKISCYLFRLFFILKVEKGYICFMWRSDR